MKTTAVFLLVTLLSVGPAGLRAADGPTGELPDPKTGGAAKGGLAILFLSPTPMLDAAYGEELSRAGFTYALSSYYDQLTYPFMKKFDVIVIDKMPIAAEEQRWFGQEMVGFRENMRLVWKCADEGAGVLVYTNLADCGGALRGGWNGEMARWGIQLQQACIIDPERSCNTWQAYGDSWYSWTEQLAPHPITAGAKRVYYPAANLRWDDCYTAPPLLADDNWTPLVLAMPGAQVATLVDHDWIVAPRPPESLVLAAVRTLGKGRLAVLSINPAYVHRMGYIRLDSNSYGEMSYGPVDGIILQKGDGAVPSDTGAVVTRMYRWLAGNPTADRHGGYQTGDPIGKAELPPSDDEKNFTRVLDFDNLVMPRAWRHRLGTIRVDDKDYRVEVNDPFITGEIRYFKALVGAHSVHSDGQGSVADYAAEAQKAGYSLLVFTENFEKLSRDGWQQLVAQCAENSTKDFVCLPGFDIMDPDNNHLIIVAPPEYPQESWLSADGKRLVKTQMINLLWYNHIVIAHRPESSPLPQERIKHYQGLTVYTYRNGRLVDDSLPAYAWQVQSWSNPHPIVVHEMFDPTQVALAARTGFQQIMPADTVQNAVAYFRVGHGHYFETPARYVISEGPILYNWVISPKNIGPAEENRRHFRVDIGLRSDAPITSVTLYDGFRLVRRWLPQQLDFQVRADFQHSRQYQLYLIAEDANGRRLLSPALRTVPKRRVQRCSDRQNWLANAGAYYTGTYLPDRLDVRMPIKGTIEGSSIFTTVPGTSMANKLSFPFTGDDVILTESILDEKYVDALFKDVGFDAMPSQASKPSAVYTARQRRYSFAPGKPEQPYPALVEFDITLRRPVEPVDPTGLFPSFGGLRGKQYAWSDPSGKMITGIILPDDVLDIPVGGLAGGFIALCEGLRVDHGQFGLAPPPGTPLIIPADTRFRARFLLLAGPSGGTAPQPQWDDDPQGWLQALGFAGRPPYTINMTRGKLALGYPAPATLDDHGVAGAVARTAEIPVNLPLELRGINENWVAGLWRDGERIDYTGTFEDTTWPLLDVGKAGRFYAGNLLLADNPHLILDIVKWTRDSIKIEVNNPTENPIEATISTPQEITDYRTLQRKVTVPPGSTVYLE